MSEEVVAVEAVCAELKFISPILDDESTFKMRVCVSPFLRVSKSLSVLTEKGKGF